MKHHGTDERIVPLWWVPIIWSHYYACSSFMNQNLPIHLLGLPFLDFIAYCTVPAAVTVLLTFAETGRNLWNLPRIRSFRSLVEGPKSSSWRNSGEKPRGNKKIVQSHIFVLAQTGNGINERLAVYVSNGPSNRPLLCNVLIVRAEL